MEDQKGGRMLVVGRREGRCGGVIGTEAVESDRERGWLGERESLVRVDKGEQGRRRLGQGTSALVETDCSVQ